MQTVVADPIALMPSDLFTRVEAAQALGLSTSRVDQLIREGTARRSVATASGRRLFSAADLESLARAIGRADRLSLAEVA